MTEREQVIAELLYLKHNCLEGSATDQTLDKAIALLREREARVMTLEEVTHSEDWIWYEGENTHCGWTIVVDCDEKWIGWEDLTIDQLCKYGKTWRCWTSRPSPEQMRDTKWEDK